MEKNHVIIALEDYNKMYEELQTLKNAFSLDVDYSGNVKLAISSNVATEIATKLFNESMYVDTHEPLNTKAVIDHSTYLMIEHYKLTFNKKKAEEQEAE